MTANRGAPRGLCGHSTHAPIATDNLPPADLRKPITSPTVGIMRELYWLQNDLRLQDNPGLLAHTAASALLLAYIWQEPRPWCNLRGIGKQRQRVILEHLQDLREQLAALGQDLLFLAGQPETLLPELVRQYRIDRVGTSRCPGVYEAQQLELSLIHI